MSSLRVKIIGLIIMLSINSLIAFLSLNLEDQNKFNVQVIEISGNNYLESGEYFKFANLDDKSKYSELSITIIKSRLEKHPYINHVDVTYQGSGRVTAEIFEKNFVAILYSNNDNSLLTNNYEVLPILPFVKNIDLPVISNLRINSDRIIKNNDGAQTAFRIISALNYINIELNNSLSEIDMRNGGDILLYFSTFEYPLIIGKGNEIKKLVYFNNLYSNLEKKELSELTEYVDLRYDGKIFIGLAS